MILGGTHWFFATGIAVLLHLVGIFLLSLTEPERSKRMESANDEIVVSLGRSARPTSRPVEAGELESDPAPPDAAEAEPEAVTGAGAALTIEGELDPPQTATSPVLPDAEIPEAAESEPARRVPAAAATPAQLAEAGAVEPQPVRISDAVQGPAVAGETAPVREAGEAAVAAGATESPAAAVAVQADEPPVRPANEVSVADAAAAPAAPREIATEVAEADEAAPAMAMRDAGLAPAAASEPVAEASEAAAASPPGTVTPGAVQDAGVAPGEAASSPAVAASAAEATAAPGAAAPVAVQYVDPAPGRAASGAAVVVREAGATGSPDDTAAPVATQEIGAAPGEVVSGPVVTVSEVGAASPPGGGAAPVASQEIDAAPSPGGEARPERVRPIQDVATARPDQAGAAARVDAIAPAGVDDAVDVGAEDVEVAIAGPATSQAEPLTAPQTAPVAEPETIDLETLQDAGDGTGVAARYAGALKGWLTANMHYPRAARLEGQEGEVVVRFVIDRAGWVQSIVLEASSGHPLLDREAREMVERGEPFPGMPGDMPGDRLEIRVPVSFDVREETRVKEMPPIFLE